MSRHATFEELALAFDGERALAQIFACDPVVSRQRARAADRLWVRAVFAHHRENKNVGTVLNSAQVLRAIDKVIAG